VSNIHTQALFRKYPFLDKYYNVNAIEKVVVAQPGDDILSIRQMFRDRYLGMDDMKHYTHEMLFLDKEGNKIASFGRYRPGFRAWLSEFMPQRLDTVGAYLFELGERLKDVHYIILKSTVGISVNGRSSSDWIGHLTLCKAPSNGPIAGVIEKRIEAEAAKLED